MSYQVLARRLRPQRFEDVVGQAHVTGTLKAAIGASRVAHAFLFTGPRGVGKTTTARILAKALNCEQGPAPEPCNACSTCREIAEGQAFDVLEIDGASHTQVDRMRDLMETVAHRPLKSRFKIYIVDEVHMLSQHSFNALLKTLEEPPPHVKFIFATTDPHRILPTVLSRCQRYDLRRIGIGELIGHLRRTVTAEGVALDEEALGLIAREAEGSLRDAQSLLEQILAAGDGTIDAGAVRTMLGAANRGLVVDVTDAILARDPATCLRLLGQLYGHGYDPQRFCRDLLEHLRNLAVVATTGDATLLADLPEGEAQGAVRQASKAGADDLQRAFRLLLATDEALAMPARTIEPQLVLEMAVLRLATLPPLLPLDDLLRRLEALEGGGGSAVAPPTAAPLRTPGASSPVAEVRAAPATPAETDMWEQFLGLVRREKLSLYMALATGRPLGVGDGIFRIGIDNEAMRRELTRRETLERLGSIASGALGAPVRVEIGPIPPSEVQDAPLARERQRAEAALADPVVQAAVDIFGAEVRGVRERRARGDV